jgi:drug/metabolite transporter (DMT)-like permease
VAAIFLLAVRFIFPPPKSTKKLTFPFWASAFANALTLITFVTANKLTSSANVVLLQYSASIWVALFAWWIIKEKPRWEQWGALVMIMGGLFIFFKDSLGTGALLGDGLAALSGISVGIHIVFLRMTKDGNPQDVLLMSHIILAVISIPFIFLYPPALSASTVLPILYMGLIQQGLTSILFAYGIKRISAILAMLTATLEPICNPIWVLLVIGEKPSPLAIIGGIIILTAVVSSSIIGKQREAARQPL